jgi:protein involved in polysaccharide export with SLBB domain
MVLNRERTTWLPKLTSHGWKLLLAAVMAACCGLQTGCTALTNPVANGIPVRLLPDELLAESREGYEPIPLHLLQGPRQGQYELAKGDTLAIYIEGVLGSVDEPPPVNIPDSPDLPPSVGYPIPVGEEGTISLPFVPRIKVAGMTIEQAQNAVAKAYRDSKIVRVDERQILVSVMRPRQIRVMVIRDDSQQRQYTLRTESFLGLGTSRTQIGGGREGLGLVLELPAYQNDVLTALTRSGGPPGLESTQEVTVQRGYWDGKGDPTGGGFDHPTEADLEGGESDRRIIRIPMRTRAGEDPGIKPEDVVLHNGDIVIVRARDPQFFYTGGLLPADEIPLPNDYDLTVVEAVLKSRGPLLNSGFNANNLNGTVIPTGLGNPSPSLLSVLRKTPNGGQVTIRVDLNEAVRDPRENMLVQADDVLILQETPDEAVARYVTQVFQINLFTRFLNRADAVGNSTIVLP